MIRTALEAFHLAGNNSELTQTQSQGESPVCWLGCSPGREGPGSQIQVRAARWNSINWEGLEILNAAWLGGSSCVGGVSLDPLGEGRELNSGLLRPKGKLLSLPYNYGDGFALLQPLGAEMDIWPCFLKSDVFWFSGTFCREQNKTVASSSPFCGTIYFFLNCIRVFYLQNRQLFTTPWLATPYHALESAENILVCAAGHMISGNGLGDWERGMATEKFDGPRRSCNYEKRMGNFIVLGKPP